MKIQNTKFEFSTPNVEILFIHLPHPDQCLTYNPLISNNPANKHSINCYCEKNHPPTNQNSRTTDNFSTIIFCDKPMSTDNSDNFKPLSTPEINALVEGISLSNNLAMNPNDSTSDDSNENGNSEETTDSDDDSDDDSDSDDDETLFLSSGITNTMDAIHKLFPQIDFQPFLDQLKNNQAKLELKNTSNNTVLDKLEQHYHQHKIIIQHIISSIISQKDTITIDQYIEIFTPLTTTIAERQLQPNQGTFDAEITFQLFLRFLDQDLAVEAARNQFASHTARRTLFSFLEDTFIVSYPELSSAIFDFLERYSNFTPQSFAFNNPLYTTFGVFLHSHYGTFGNDTNDEVKIQSSNTNNNNTTNDELTIQSTSSNNNNTNNTTTDENIITNTTQDNFEWALYIPKTPKLNQKLEDDEHVAAIGHHADDETSDDDNNFEQEGVLVQYMSHERQLLYQQHLQRRQERAKRREQERSRRLFEHAVIYTKTVFPPYDIANIKPFWHDYVEISFTKHKELLTRIKEEQQSDTTTTNLASLSSSLSSSLDTTTQSPLSSLLPLSNNIQQVLVYQLFIVPFPLRGDIHLTLARESWLYSLRYLISKTHITNLITLFKAHHFNHHFILPGSITLLLSPQQAAAARARKEEIKNGVQWNYRNDVGLLDLTYVNCMARYWIQFDTDDNNNNPNDQNETNIPLWDNQRRVLIDNGADMLEAVIEGAIDSLLNYEIV